MSKILVIGNKGSMGRRYMALLKYFGLEAHGADVETPIDVLMKVAKDYSGVIVATPTNTHYDILTKLADTNTSVLCEKPITKNLDELEHILELYKNKSFQMVMQYKELDTGGRGNSFYDYYNHGRDGLYWDCLQVIGLARGRVMLSESSPFWRCRLNGVDLDLSKMDFAYSWMLQRWFKNPKGDLKFLKDIHYKVADMESQENAKSTEKDSSRDSSAFY